MFQAHQQAEDLYIIQSGQARLYDLTQDDREMTLNVMGQGELLGCYALLSTSRYNMYAEALNDVFALQFSGAVIREQMQEYPDLGSAMTAQLVRQNRYLQDRLTQLTFLEVAQRLALHLLTLLDQSQQPSNKGPLAVPTIALQGRISHQDLAYAVGSTRETITKILGEFRTQGLLDLGYRRIVVLDRAGLEQAALYRPTGHKLARVT